MIVETKVIFKNLASPTPYNASDKSKRNTASIKKEKYSMPKSVRITVSQKGINSTENKRKITKQIRTIITTYYTQSFKLQVSEIKKKSVAKNNVG